MNWVALFKKVAFGAGEAAVDLGGSVLLPGAWPILRSAAQPVMDALKGRLGLKEANPSPAQTERMVAAFETDRQLQSTFASALIEQLEPFTAGQKEANADIKRLIEIVGGNSQLLDAVLAGTEQLAARLDEGVNLSAEAIAKVAEQVEIVRRMRSMAWQEMGLAGELIERQLSRLQIRADELLEEGAPDRAADELREGVTLLSVLLSQAPSDIDLQIQLGFMFKTMAQLFEAVGDDGSSSEYVGKAESVFDLVKKGVAADQKTALQIANAMHGMCNVRHAKKDLRGAIACYEQVVDVCPQHAYAWHDMFLAQYELAKQGERVDLDAMRHALEETEKTGAGMPGLGAAEIRTMRSMLREVQPNAPASG
jgi:hypothetical protein